MRYPVFRTRHVGSATPGAVVDRTNHNFGTASPQWGGLNRRKPLRFCAPEMFCPPQGVTPVNGVRGKATMSTKCSSGAVPGGVLVTLPPWAKSLAARRRRNSPAHNKRNPKPAPSSVTALPCHLSLSPLAFGHFPLIKGTGRRDREEAAKYPALCIYYG